MSGLAECVRTLGKGCCTGLFEQQHCSYEQVFGSSISAQGRDWIGPAAVTAAAASANSSGSGARMKRSTANQML